MSQDSQYLIDMLHAIERILDYVSGESLYDFYEDVQLQDKVMSKVLKLRKTASRISQGARDVLGDINWHTLDALQSRLMHEDKTVDVDTLWHVVRSELPRLADTLNAQLLCAIE